MKEIFRVSMGNMLKELQDMGLSEKEARVYMAALELGRATADQLAKQSKLVRSTTYVQLESLMKIGLMSTYEEGKKTYFAPESPELLRRLLARQKDELASKENGLSDLLPGLLQQFESAGERPVVRFFPGKEGIISLREEVLGVKEKKIYVISPNDEWSKVFTPEEQGRFSDRRAAKQIETKLLYTGESKITDPLPPFTERGYIEPDKLTLSTEIVIFDDKVGIITLKGTWLGTILTSKAIQESMLSIFNFIWLASEKH